LGGLSLFTNSKRNILIGLVLLLTGCSQANPASTTKGHPIYISDAHNVETFDLTNNQEQVVKNGIFIQSLHFDPQKKRVIAPGYSPEESFIGLLYIENNKLIKKSTDPFAPVHLYQYKNKYVMDSAEALVDGNTIATNVGIFDSNTEKFLKELKLIGLVTDIVGNESKVYISSFCTPSESNEKKKSNIYELDLNTNKVRPILKQNEKRVPLQIAYYNGFLYGIYPRDGSIERTQCNLAKINLSTGEIEKEIPLNSYAKDPVISVDGKNIYVSHFYQPGSDVKIPNPISKINLDTFKVELLSGDFRAASLIQDGNKLYVGSDMEPKLVVVDEKNFKIEKTINTKITTFYLQKP
jgi:rRNA processing protein Gar1